MKRLVFWFLFLVTFITIPAESQTATENPPEAAPGIPLPAKGGIYALDPGSNPQLVKLKASEVLLNRQTASNLAKRTLYVGSRETLEISGLTAQTSLESGESSFFIHLNPDEPALQLGRITLVRLESSDKSRVVAALDTNVFGGGAKRKLQIVEVTKQTLPGDEWVKVTPTQKLASGHYAITMLPKDPKMFPDTAFDFWLAGTTP